MAATISGCSEEFGPERFPTAAVRGTIRVSGRPISSGWVEFVPIEGTRGDLRSAPIGPDGSFSADRVPVGRVSIRVADVFGPPIPTSLGPVKLDTFRSYQTPIRREIPAQGGTPLDIDLVSEAEAYRRNQFERSRRMNDPEG